MQSAGRHPVRAECTRLHLDSPGRRGCTKRTACCFVQRDIHSNEKQLERLRTAKRARLSERRLSACATARREARLDRELDDGFDDDGDDGMADAQRPFAAGLDLHARAHHDDLFASPGSDDGFASAAAPPTDEGDDAPAGGATLASVTPIVHTALTKLAAPWPTVAPVLSPVPCAALAELGARPSASDDDDAREASAREASARGASAAAVPAAREASGCGEPSAALPCARMVFKSIPKAHNCLGRLYTAVVVGRLMYAEEGAGDGEEASHELAAHREP